MIPGPPFWLRIEARLFPYQPELLDSRLKNLAALKHPAIVLAPRIHITVAVYDRYRNSPLMTQRHLPSLLPPSNDFNLLLLKQRQPFSQPPALITNLWFRSQPGEDLNAFALESSSFNLHVHHNCPLDAENYNAKNIATNLVQLRS